jgi:DNA-binding GntR family transcriptional regulator
MSTQDFNQIDPDKLVDLAEGQLLSSILEGRTGHGERIVEAEVARQMGISRAPLREAIRRLEGRGLLVTVARKGVFVRSYSAIDVEQVAQFRQCIEQFAVRCLAGAPSVALKRKLAQLQAEFAERFKNADARTILEANLNFHRGLVDLVGNTRLSISFENLANELRLIHSLTKAATDWDFINPSTYSPLIEWICAGDVAASLTEIERLIEGFRRRGIAHFSHEPMN